MEATQITAKPDEKVEALLSAALDSGMQALATLVGQQVKGQIAGCGPVEPEQLLADIGSQHAVVLGALNRDYEGQVVRIVIPACEASTLSGYVMMTPEETIEERRKSGTLEGEDLETFAEVANVLCSGFATALRDALSDDIVMRAQDSGTVEPGGEAPELLGSQSLIGYSFELAVGEHPESRGWLLLEPSTAERWNGKPLDATEEEDDIPAAPVRGQLTAYLVEQEVLEVLRKSCRRVGLELDRRSRTEVPNPAEHKDDLVLMDVPAGDTRRFDWCKRLKQYHPTVKVVLLIHRPSRSQVLKGFLAKADAIMAWPINEQELSPKLDALLAPSEPDAPDEPAAEE